MTTFTRSEIALLRHRLEVCDCICEVLADDESDEIALVAINDPGKVRFVTLQLMGEVEMGRSVEYVTALAQRDPLWAAVLRDAVQGSTYVACIPDDEPQRRGAAIRAARRVNEKLRAAGFVCGDVPEL